MSVASLAVALFFGRMRYLVLVENDFIVCGPVLNIDQSTIASMQSFLGTVAMLIH